MSLQFIPNGPINNRPWICSDNGLVPIRRQAIIWTTDGLVYWRIYVSLTVAALTHWGRNKMAAIFQTTFSNAFSWMKMFRFRLLWRLFQRVQLTIFPSLVQVMAWRRPGDKPLSEQTMVSLLTHICVTRPQWVKIRFRFCFSLFRCDYVIRYYYICILISPYVSGWHWGNGITAFMIVI